MNTRVRRFALPFVIAMSVLVAGGCAEPVGGQADETPVPEITFHPCDGFSSEALAAVRLDARPPDRMPDRNNPQNFGCGFQSQDSYSGIVVSAIGEAPDSVKSDDRFNILSETEIGGRRALVSDFRGGSACTVSVAIEPGILEFMIGYSELEDFTTVDAACDQATKVATTLAPYFPDHL